jgi:LysR family transcriptional regulator, cell division regulator
VRLPPILTAFAAACPKVSLVLRTGTTDGLTAEVLEYQLEGALVAGPVGHPELVEEPVVEEELVLVTAPGCRDPWAAWAEAGEARLLVFRAGCTYRQRLASLLAGRGVTATRWLEFGTLEGIIGCVGAGLGSTLLPRAVVERARREGRVTTHRLAAGQGRAVTVFIRRRDAVLSGALARFLECSQAAHRSARAGDKT